MKKTVLFFAGLAILIYKNQAQTVTDIDGNVYNTVTIGTQVWLKENLRVAHFRNGNAIPNVSDILTWTGLNTAARCYYDNDSAAYKSVYGGLYNWIAVDDSRKLCPTDWHVPSLTEWTTLENHLGGFNVAGGKLKEAGTTHWSSPNTADNSSGFSALPGGLRQDDGLFNLIRTNCAIWLGTQSDVQEAWNIDIDQSAGTIQGTSPKKLALSVRCISDFAASFNDIQDNNNIRIFPNPAANRIYICFTEKQNVKMQVLNVIGECVLQKELNNRMNETDISSLTKGIYIIQLTGGYKTIQQKLIKN